MAVQASGTSGNDTRPIDGPERLRAWLEDKPPDWARDMAVRFASRLLPLIGGVFNTDDEVWSPERRKEFILPPLRACFVAWVACRYRDANFGGIREGASSAAAAVDAALQRDLKQAEQASDASALDKAGIAYVARAAAGRAASVIVDSEAVRTTACETIAQAIAGLRDALYVLDATEPATAAWEADLWASVEADRRWLEAENIGDLVNQSLWADVSSALDALQPQGGAPRWIGPWLASFAQNLDAPWSLWTEWYNNIVQGADTPQIMLEHEVEIASQLPAFWEREPDKVVNDIADMIGWPANGSGQSIESSGGISLETGGPQLPSEAPTSPQESEPGAEGGEAGEDGVSPPGAALVSNTPVQQGAKPASRKRPPPTPPPTPRLREAVRIYSDEPTASDKLGRRPFAQALGERMDDVRAQGAPDGFAVHLHAPWGAGKTSVLMMMDEFMSASSRPVDKRWVVVFFNAWKNERRKPPWWPLVQQTYICCRHCLWNAGEYRRWASVASRWLLWRLVADWFPYVVASLVFLVLAYVWWFWGRAPVEPVSEGWLGYFRQLANGRMPWDAYPPVLRESWFEALQRIAANVLGKMVALFTTLAAVFATFVAVGRAIVFGSPDTAKFYSDLSADPLRRVTSLFESIVRRTGKPVAIFIDDLDRCDKDYVVDLLEGIQTLFRGPNVAFVVAADRAWIKAAFEKHYEIFKADVGDAGQPLGYLFLEKMFQVSVPVPGMGDRVKETYWTELVEGQTPPRDMAKPVASTQVGAAERVQADKAAKTRFDASVAVMREQLRSETGDNVTNAAVDQFLEKRGDAPDVRAAAALEVSASPAVRSEAEHLLGRFKDTVGEVPRVMKRMINAFAMRRAIGILEGNTISQDALARWTILEQRWPALADLLIEKPERLDDLSRKLTPANLAKLDTDWKPFANLAALQSVIGKEKAGRLTAKLVATITHGSASVSSDPKGLSRKRPAAQRPAPGKSSLGKTAGKGRRPSVRAAP